MKYHKKLLLYLVSTLPFTYMTFDNFIQLRKILRFCWQDSFWNITDLCNHMINNRSTYWQAIQVLRFIKKGEKNYKVLILSDLTSILKTMTNIGPVRKKFDFFVENKMLFAFVENYFSEKLTIKLAKCFMEKFEFSRKKSKICFTWQTSKVSFVR